MHRNTKIRIAVGAIATGMIIWGMARGEIGVMFMKSIHVCLECIGLG